MEEKKQIRKQKAILIFSISTIYFFILLFTVLPYLRSQFDLNPELYWFITGYFLFIPLLAFFLFSVKKESNTTLSEMVKSLNIKPMNKNDWIYAIITTLLVFIFTGLVFGVSIMLHKQFGIQQLNTVPWFMEMHPFQGKEKLLLLVWLPMFVFNILGEELLWRGYIQTRLEGKFAWIICSLLWLAFHLPFGIDLMIMLLPIVILLPYAYHKTKNTLVGVFIHGVYNGPMFVLVALGIIK